MKNIAKYIYIFSHSSHFTLSLDFPKTIPDMKLHRVTVITFFIMVAVTAVSTHRVRVHLPNANLRNAKIFEFHRNTILSFANRSLSNHGFQTFSTKHHVSQCAMECLKNEQCKSFNFFSRKRYCQLNNATSDDFPEDFMVNEWEYHHRESFSIDPEALGPCVPNPCENGARCLDTRSAESGRTALCLCSEDWTGEYCSIPAKLPDWGEWQSWDACSASCNEGWSLRRRVCQNANIGEEIKSSNCYGRDEDYKACDLLPCPKWGEWGEWGMCSTVNTCGDGIKVRNRYCMNGGTAGKDRFCLGHTNQSTSCTGIKCQGVIRLAGGSEYGEGQVLIYDNLRMKFVEVCADNWDILKADTVCKQIGFLGGHAAVTDGRYSDDVYENERVVTKCEGEEKSLQSCERTPPDPESCLTTAGVQCQVKGAWSLWGSWGECSVTCENGTRMRSRTCSHPPPSNNGRLCEGPDKDYKDCTLSECPEDGYWEKWTPWSDCSTTCANGTKERTRTCKGQLYGGEPCEGLTTDVNECFLRFCPVDGDWMNWEPWSTCTLTCGSGNRRRSRECMGQAYDGALCPGEQDEEEVCNDLNCPVDGSWELWVEWSSCSVTCGGGIRNRSRECNEAMYEGTECIGPAEQMEICEDDPCPVDGYWEEWEKWTACSRTCSDGTRSRERICIQPLHEGENCNGEQTEEEDCFLKECPVDGVWNEWHGWEGCSVQCNGGEEYRFRECEDPLYDGEPCDGPYNETRTCNTQNCPVDGNWTNWEQWGECTVTCGGGTQTRNRTCIGPFYGGVNCTGDDLKDRSCSDDPCPVDGEWHPWTNWTQCNVSCAGGNSWRTRKCQTPQHGGEKCVGEALQATECNTQNCPVAGFWDDWSGWTDCSKTCENGTQTRSRQCVGPFYDGENCVGNDTETRLCNPLYCPIDGDWVAWTDWSQCSLSCGRGVKYRNRTCTGPFYGGENCTGDYDDTDSCNPNECPVNGIWLTWQAWLECSVTCAKGTRERTRTCQPPEFGGTNCTGPDTEVESCYPLECPVDGIFQTWSSWSECSLSCGNGTHFRTRTCKGPYHDGENCTGDWDETEFCNTHFCPVDGNWTEWTNWDTCSLTCGGGIQWHYRTCYGPFYNGENCTGPGTESQDCNIHPCPVDGVWLPWSAWGQCDLTCGGGIQDRSRNCDEPQYDGDPCEGNTTDYQECNTHNCPEDGVWLEWEEWASCDLTCGGGMTWRSRVCHGPFHDGKDCWGEKHSFSPCSENPCPVDGVLTPWQQWNECDVTCGGGVQHRERLCNPPKNGGALCVGDLAEIRSCNTDLCPVNGYWNNWNEWSDCNVTCNGGKQVRLRICEPPKYNGDECHGNATRHKICNTNPCPIPGIWLEWSSWSLCSMTCGSGIRIRNRKCNDTAYGNLTVPCEGNSIEDAVCHNFSCEPYCATCSEWAARGLRESTTADVQPDPNMQPFKIHCDMESNDGIGVTVIEHRHENRTNVTGFEGAGIYKIVINYTIEFEQAKKIVERSSYCEQYLKWECKAATVHNPFLKWIWITFWENVDGINPKYFPGAKPGDGKCACGVTGTCANKTLPCNCDMNDNVWRFDDGIIKEKEQLPISAFRVGDTGNDGEFGSWTVGPVKCTTNWTTSKQRRT